MRIAKTLSYRFGDELLASPKFVTLKNELISVLAATPVPALAKPKHRTRNGSLKTFTTDQRSLNLKLDDEFRVRGWDVHPYIVEGARETNLQADYKKGRVQVEVQFGNMARWYTDVFKFQVSYSLEHIDLGVLVVAVQAFANTIDENVVYFERVERELPYAKMSITIPIWVIGVTADDELPPESGDVSRRRVATSSARARVVPRR
ncbi:MAG TPA: BglII/BstYI family type II restriction endonuclease [Candidatus Binatia bacterium]|jgi:hypothetical protein|nr:BglII/BstYI family type II restriction endonuclease [Candidatus Binatia bacterium]